MSLIGILVALLVFCVVIWAARSLLSAYGIEDPIKTTVYVVLVVVGLFVLLGYLGVVPGRRLVL